MPTIMKISPQGKIRIPNKFMSLLGIRELEENNIRISCRTFVRLQGVMIGA